MQPKLVSPGSVTSSAGAPPGYSAGAPSGYSPRAPERQRQNESIPAGYPPGCSPEVIVRHRRTLQRQNAHEDSSSSFADSDNASDNISTSDDVLDGDNASPRRWCADTSLHAAGLFVS